VPAGPWAAAGSRQGLHPTCSGDQRGAPRPACFQRANGRCRWATTCTPCTGAVLQGHRAGGAAAAAAGGAGRSRGARAPGPPARGGGRHRGGAGGCGRGVRRGGRGVGGAACGGRRPSRGEGMFDWVRCAATSCGNVGARQRAKAGRWLARGLQEGWHDACSRLLQAPAAATARHAFFALHPSAHVARALPQAIGARVAGTLSPGLRSADDLLKVVQEVRGHAGMPPRQGASEAAVAPGARPAVQGCRVRAPSRDARLQPDVLQAQEAPAHPPLPPPNPASGQPRSGGGPRPRGLG
jgi:hypothetical protein